MQMKRYLSSDMVKISCPSCNGCGACCRGMGDTILLDPYDVYTLCKALEKPFAELLESRIALTVTDGMILPHMKMNETTGACSFLDEEGRCSIHEHRPGLCRLYPLGRDYANGSFRYFVVGDECPPEEKAKVKISKWIGTPRMPSYEKFLVTWHYFVREMQGKFMLSKDEEYSKQMNMFILQTFFIAPYDANKDFYEMFEKRLEQVRKVI